MLFKNYWELYIIIEANYMKKYLVQIILYYESSWYADIRYADGVFRGTNV